MSDYNFFEPYQQRASLSLDIKSPALLAILSVIAIAGVSIGLLVSNRISASELAEAKTNLSTIEASAEYIAANEIQTAIDAMTLYDENAALALGRIEKGEILSTEFLTSLSASMPETSKLLRANITRTYSDFSFYLPSRGAAAELIDSLDQSGLFVHTFLSEIVKDGPGYRAEINVVMKAGGE